MQDVSHSRLVRPMLVGMEVTPVPVVAVTTRQRKASGADRD